MQPQFIKTFRASVALLAYQAVILDGSNPGNVKLDSGANGKVIGYAVNDAAQDQEVAVFLVGPAFKGIAGDTSIGIGDYVMLEGADGKLKKYADDNSLQNACGISLDAATAEDQVLNIVVLAFKAETALT